MTGTPLAQRELVITRLIDAPREALFRCWTEPKLLEQWFAPAPITTQVVTMDPRAGGVSEIVMRAPDGQTFPSRGVYLEVTPNERIVFTDAFVDAWEPSEKPFFVGVVTFTDEGGGTRYEARARHWTKEDRDAHEAMGFVEGWGKCADQLAALAKTL
jgi:uncharacterized protein YndB with AHSA1/START domain